MNTETTTRSPALTVRSDRKGMATRPFVLLIALLAALTTACASSHAAAVVSPTGVAASATKTAIPKQLTGGWGRGNKAQLMIVGRRGKVAVDGVYDAEFSNVTAHRLTVGYVLGLTLSGVPAPGCSKTGTYRWKIANHASHLASHLLELKKIHDACKPRVDLFAGIWLRARHG